MIISLFSMLGIDDSFTAAHQQSYFLPLPPPPTKQTALLVIAPNRRAVCIGCAYHS